MHDDSCRSSGIRKTYTLNRVSNDLSLWVCEKRGTCKGRVHTRNDIIVKPVLIVSEIQQAHTHTPSQVRAQMLKDYRKMKDIASNSEQSTRGILSIAIGEMNSVLPDLSRRTPLFPIRIWNLHRRVNSRLARTNNSVEGWQNAFKLTVVGSHQSFCKLSMFFKVTVDARGCSCEMGMWRSEKKF